MVVANGNPAGPATFATTVPGPSPTPATFTMLWVYVSDALLRDVPGATVQIVNADRAGFSSVTDAKGSVYFEGTFSRSVTVRVTKDGFIARETTAGIDPASYKGAGFGRVSIELEAPDPLQIEPGKYSLTIATGASCADFP